jgi:hypothetical protein
MDSQVPRFNTRNNAQGKLCDVVNILLGEIFCDGLLIVVVEFGGIISLISGGFFLKG